MSYALSKELRSFRNQVYLFSKHLCVFSPPRYALQRAERVRCKVVGVQRLCTFTVVVETLVKGCHRADHELMFEVTVAYSLLRHHGLDLVKLSRLSRYSEFKACADAQVDLYLCTCDLTKSPADRTKGKPSYIWDVFSHYMFSHPSRIRKLQGSCLYVVLTQRERALRRAQGKDSISFYEILNVCSDKVFNVTVSDASFVRKPFVLSKSLPFGVTVYPNTIQHVVSAFCGLPNGMFVAKFHVVKHAT